MAGNLIAVAAAGTALLAALALAGCAPRESAAERRFAEQRAAFVTGRVQAPVPLRVRGKSHRRAHVHQRYASGERIRVRCRVRGERVHGDRVWYRLSGGRYVSGHYVRIARNRVPKCR